MIDFAKFLHFHACFSLLYSETRSPLYFQQCRSFSELSLIHGQVDRKSPTSGTLGMLHEDEHRGAGENVRKVSPDPRCFYLLENIDDLIFDTSVKKFSVKSSNQVRPLFSLR